MAFCCIQRSMHRSAVIRASSSCSSWEQTKRATVRHCVAYSAPNGMSPLNSSVFRKPLTRASRKIQYPAGIEETNKTKTPPKSLWLMLTLHIMARRLRQHEQALHEFATDMVLELNIEVDAFSPILKAEVISNL